MSFVSKALDRWFGRGEFSVTVPPMDGAFRPNDKLDAAMIDCQTPAPDAIAVTVQGLVVSSGRSLMSVERPGETVATFDAEITAICGKAVALADGRIHVGGSTITAPSELRCITALTSASDGALLIANGSAINGSADWKRDLMSGGASGSVWRLDVASGAFQKLAGDLAYPYGLVEDGGSIIVSESWRAALTRIAPGGARPQRVVEALPAYPSRITPAQGGGFWLSLFAPRSQLVEFVLREPGYREKMMAQMDPAFWVAPTLRSGRSALEPTQQGGVKQLGVLKPWSPTRSYGLVARLDNQLRPIASWHSRANGGRHGVTSCSAHNGRVYFTAKGDDVVASFAEPGAAS